MNFLAQVMATAGEAEMLDLKSRIAETEKKVSSLDTEVKEYLENNYAKFAILEENHLMLKAQDLISKVADLKTRITSQVKKELDDSTDEVSALNTKLSETDACLSIVKEVLVVDELIKDVEENHDNKFYLEAAKKFKVLHELLLTNKSVQNLAVYKSLMHYVSMLQDRLLSDSLQVWNNFISWEEVELSEKSKSLTLTINNQDSNSDVIRALLYYDYLDYEINVLSEKLFKNLIKPVITYQTSLKIISEEGKSTISVVYKSNQINGDGVSSNMPIIDKLIQIFEILFTSLDVFIDENETFINKLGELLGTDFCECFKENCLYKAIPTRREELNEFSRVVDKVSEFNRYLKNNGFITPYNDLMVEYVKNVDQLFVAKTSQAYLNSARKIFDKNLQDMVQVTPTSYQNEGSHNDSEVLLCENLLQRPSCYISTSVKELMQLIRTGLDEVQRNNSIPVVEIFYAIRNIVTLYIDLMPLKHSALLKSIPQQAALFYNNCMYLAHELVSLGIECTALQQEDVIFTFVDFIEPLRLLGVNVFNSQISIQQDQLLEILEKSGVSRLAEFSVFPSSIEKSLSQCLRQLYLLQSVWHNILPVNIYCKTIGMLCTCVVEKLIDSVLALVDISMDVANQLTDVFTAVVNKIPTLFPDSKEVYRHVRRWSKFSELCKVLSGGLKDIDDRWADGKGPLAQEFTSDQVKHLIRALFQATDRRSALLSRIK